MIIHFLQKNPKVSITGKNIYFFGDSITEAENGWVDMLSSYYSINKTNKGIAGTMLTNMEPVYTQPSMIDRLGEIPEYNNNLALFFAYGVNDTYQGRSFSNQYFFDTYQVIINNCVQKGWDKRYIFILDIYYYTNTNYANETRVLELNEVIKGFSLQNGIKYIPVHDFMKNNGGESLLLPDNVHPNNLGHQKIFQCILNSLS